MCRKQKVRLSPHAIRRHRERATAWGVIDLWSAATNAWNQGKHHLTGKNSRIKITHRGYTYIFAPESTEGLHSQAMQSITLVTYMTELMDKTSPSWKTI